MPEIFSDLDFLDVLIGLIGLLITVLGIGWAIYERRRNRKQLQYSVLYNSPLVSVEEEAKDKIEVSFNGQPIDDPRWAGIKITNGGRHPIRSDDFEGGRGLTVSFGSEATILEANVVEVEPIQLKPHIKIENNLVVIEPLLLNGGDSFSIRVVGSGFDESDVNVSSRISGVKQIREKSIPSENDALLSKEMRLILVTGTFVILAMILNALINRFLYLPPNSINSNMTIVDNNMTANKYNLTIYDIALKDSVGESLEGGYSVDIKLDDDDFETDFVETNFRITRHYNNSINNLESLSFAVHNSDIGDEGIDVKLIITNPSGEVIEEMPITILRNDGKSILYTLPVE